MFVAPVSVREPLGQCAWSLPFQVAGWWSGPAGRMLSYRPDRPPELSYAERKPTTV